MVKFLNIQSRASIEIHRQLCQVYGPFRTSGVGCLVPVLSWCTIMLGHTRLDGQHISCISPAGRCLIIHPISQISYSVIFIFSITSKNSSPVGVSVFPMYRGGDDCHTVVLIADVRLTAHEYNSRFHGMTNISIPEVNI